MLEFLILNSFRCLVFILFSSFLLYFVLLFKLIMSCCNANIILTNRARNKQVGFLSIQLFCFHWIGMADAWKFYRNLTTLNLELSVTIAISIQRDIKKASIKYAWCRSLFSLPINIISFDRLSFIYVKSHWNLNASVMDFIHNINKSELRLLHASRKKLLFS